MNEVCTVDRLTEAMIRWYVTLLICCFGCLSSEVRTSSVSFLQMGVRMTQIHSIPPFCCFFYFLSFSNGCFIAFKNLERHRPTNSLRVEQFSICHRSHAQCKLLYNAPPPPHQMHNRSCFLFLTPTRIALNTILEFLNNKQKNWLSPRCPWALSWTWQRH